MSHGQPSDPEPAAAALAGFAARVAPHLPGWHVGAATLAQPGALDAALAAAGGAPRVYPLFMTEGWFTGENLRNRLSGAPGAEILRPLGVSPALPALAADLLRHEIAQAGWRPAETHLFLAGHGSGRSGNSARDTRAFAAALARHLPLAGIRVGFVEEPPFLAEAATGGWARGASACRSLPRRAGMSWTTSPRRSTPPGFAAGGSRRWGWRPACPRWWRARSPRTVSATARHLR